MLNEREIEVLNIAVNESNSQTEKELKLEISRLKERVNVPIIAGGLIETKIEIDEALKAGAYAISTSNVGLWK
mgnify:CR=1 FL=1